MIKDQKAADVSHPIFRVSMRLSRRLLAAELIVVSGMMFLLTGLTLLNVSTRKTGIPKLLFLNSTRSGRPKIE